MWAESMKLGWECSPCQGGKRVRSAEDDEVFLDNYHTHKRYLSEMMKRPADQKKQSNGLNRKASAQEWRLFMSSRISDTLKGTTSRKLRKNDDEAHEEQEFKKIYKEVEQLGTSLMSWRERKHLETKKVLALGAKPEKGHKMPIAMGLNIKRKRESLEQQKMQEDALGGLRLPKNGKKKKIRTMENVGLRASEGVFKGGVLYVKPLSAEDGRDAMNEDRENNKKHYKKSKSKKGKTKRP